jgi:hypothetical protein
MLKSITVEYYIGSYYGKVIVEVQDNESEENILAQARKQLDLEAGVELGASSGCGRGQKVKKDERITPSATKTN